MRCCRCKNKVNSVYSFNYNICIKFLCIFIRCLWNLSYLQLFNKKIVSRSHNWWFCQFISVFKELELEKKYTINILAYRDKNRAVIFVLDPLKLNKNNRASVQRWERILTNKNLKVGSIFYLHLFKKFPSDWQQFFYQIRI